MKKNNSNLPFYKKPVYIILFFIFFPPIGIPLLFKFLKSPSKKIKIALSVIWSVVWIGALISSNMSTYRTYEINNKEVTITCASYCDYIDEYGDTNVLKTLATIGIRKVKTAQASLSDNEAKVTVESPSLKATDLVVKLLNQKLTKIHNYQYPTIIYYSTNPDDKVLQYPAQDEIDAIDKINAEKAAAERAAKEAEDAIKAKQEAERKAAEAKVPSSVDAITICDNAFHSRYPYKGSTVHSILGVITNSPYGPDTRLYKVEVTIQNAFGASYDAVMECLTQKSADNMISIQTFNVY